MSIADRRRGLAIPPVDLPGRDRDRRVAEALEEVGLERLDAAAFTRNEFSGGPAAAGGELHGAMVLKRRASSCWTSRTSALDLSVQAQVVGPAARSWQKRMTCFICSCSHRSEVWCGRWAN